MKYTPENGSVSIAVDAMKDAAVVEVRDTGIGIAEDHLPKIFERFYKAAAARTTEVAGLGLSIGRWIVEHHEGSIGVESSPPHGSTFSVRLPFRLN